MCAKSTSSALTTDRPEQSAGGGARAIKLVRVAHVINTAEIGGGAEHLFQLTRGLKGLGFDSTVLVGRDGPVSDRLRASGAAVETLGSLGVGAPLKLAARLTAIAPDLLHLHGSRAGLAGALAARAARVGPVLYTAHMFSFLRRWSLPLGWAAARAEALTCAVADRVICVSMSDRDAAAARGIPVERLEVVPNGIDLKRFPALRDRRAEFQLDPHTPVVGMVARLVPQKDPLTFARAARRIAQELPGTRFLMVGDGRMRAPVEEAARSLIEQGQLIVTGFRSDVPELLATMDVVAFPSLWEAQGIALIEAMAASRAVVASELPAHAEAIVDGESGVLVPPHDPARLADVVCKLLADDHRREALGRRARQRVEARYGVERMIEATVEIYRSVLASAR